MSYLHDVQKNVSDFGQPTFFARKRCNAFGPTPIQYRILGIIIVVRSARNPSQLRGLQWLGGSFLYGITGRTIQGYVDGFFVLGELKLLKGVVAHTSGPQYGGNLDCEMILLFKNNK